MLPNIRKALIKSISRTNIGFNTVNGAKRILGKLPKPNYAFPNSISIETSSVCNLACIHCPPHCKEYKNDHRPYGHINMDLFNKIMDEIDNNGSHKIALHKDGEPLLHPNIVEILNRVKRHRDHCVYLTTNAHKLNKEIGDAILSNKIDIINFSLGAANKEFYKKVRGNGFEKVQENIHGFLHQVKNSDWKPRVIVQIIDLPEYKEMKDQIKQFCEYWNNFNVDTEVYSKLTWGVLKTDKVGIKRYPCFSLWNSLFVNSNGKVSPCCMDWKHDLIIGDAEKQTIEKIWQGALLYNLRKHHINKKENELPLCGRCNYWHTVPKLSEYSVKGPDFQKRGQSAI